MSPRSLIVLLAVGLCATLVASGAAPRPGAGPLGAPLGGPQAARAPRGAYPIAPRRPTPAELALSRARHDRAVQELLAAAKQKLLQIVASLRDAALASVETISGYYLQLEQMVLEAGTEKLYEYGIEVNLTVVAAVVKHNVKTCVQDETITSQGKAIMLDLATCITKDMDSLKRMMRDMKRLWKTAKSIPSTMTNVANQCREHVPGDPLKDKPTDDDIHDKLAGMVGGDPFAVLKGTDASALLESVEDEEIVGHGQFLWGTDDEDYEDSDEEMDEDAAHDLAAKATELLDKAARTMTKRDAWSLDRITRCVKSVYSLSKSDLVTIPGQIVALASNGYKVYQSANSGIHTCVGVKATTNVPAMIKMIVDLGLCVAESNVDDLIAKYPALVGIRKVIDLAQRLAKLRNVSMDDVDFMPRIVAENLPPSLAQGLATAHAAYQIYKDAKSDFAAIQQLKAKV